MLSQNPSFWHAMSPTSLSTTRYSCNMLGAATVQPVTLFNIGCTPNKLFKSEVF